VDPLPGVLELAVDDVDLLELVQPPRASAAQSASTAAGSTALGPVGRGPDGLGRVGSFVGCT
jgi:hypothetical protein